MYKTDKTWRAIQEEAELAAEHIAFGATILGRANYARKAYYYQAFFSLSVGFERAAKLALAIDHSLEYGHFPTNKELRSYGHRLKELLEKVDEMSRRRGFSDRLPSSDIHNAIVNVLTNFASNVTRYYNLDAITGAPVVNSVRSPLASWYEDVLVRVAQRHYSKKTRERDEHRVRALSDLYEDHTFVIHFREDGQLLHTFFDAVMHGEVSRRVQPYARMYVMQIARFIARVFMELTYLAAQAKRHDIPYLVDMFAIFENKDGYFRDRSRWSIYA